MKTVNWKTLRVTFLKGEAYAEKEVTLDKGERIVAAVATSEMPTQLVNLGLYENGQEVSAPMDLSFWRRSNSGQFLDGFKPLGITGGSTISARLSTTGILATTNDLQVEIAFAIIQDSKEC